MLLTERELPKFLQIRNAIRNSLHDSREFTLDECQIWFESKPQDYWLILTSDTILGYFRFEVDPTDQNFGIIGMDLDPVFHGLGYAKKLYQIFCSDIVPSYEVSNLRLRVLKTNSRAYSLYVSMGFAISEETPVDYEMQISLEELISNLSTQLG